MPKESKEDCYHLGVKALIRNALGEILLLKVNPQLKRSDIETYWNIPGGRVQRGDTVEQTLIREVKEEMGVKVLRIIKPLAMVLSNFRLPVETGDVGLVLAIYQCEIEPDAAIQLSEEHNDKGWFAPEDAAALLAVKYPKDFTDEIHKLAFE